MAAWKKKYRAVLFDADNTLFDFDGSEADAFRKLAAVVGLPGPLEEAYTAYRRANEEAWKKLEAGLLDFQSLKVARFRTFLADLGIDRDPEAVSRTYLAILSGSARLFPRALEVLEALSRRFPLALVTNGLSEVQRGRIERQGLDRFFRCILISEEIGLSKPDPAFFKEACRRLGVAPSEALCVGDNPVADIRGAHDSGMDACWCDFRAGIYPDSEPGPTYVIRSLEELMTLEAADG